MKSIYFLSFNMISFVPYAFGFLKSYALQNPLIAAAYRWHPPLTTPQPVDDVVAGINDPDLLCLSCYVWNHNQQMAIARRVKAHYPNCLVVCGGPHVPDQPGDFFFALSPCGRPGPRGRGDSLCPPVGGGARREARFRAPGGNIVQPLRQHGHHAHGEAAGQRPAGAQSLPERQPGCVSG